MTPTGKKDQDIHDPGYLRFVRTPFFLAVTIGIPFCIYKGLFGLLAIRAGTPGAGLLVTGGILITTWAGVDLLMNMSRAILDMMGKPDLIEFCSLAQIGKYVGMPEVFLAVDTLISFSIICFTLWSSWITLFDPLESYLWYAATTLNLISVSLVMVFTEAWKVKYSR
ncbi:MAG: hypothetical protein LUQ25_06925 [Methanoregulaceae archaeon]|nr:hypothetical protein [Methanoregulaceae archaeon]